MRTERAHLSTNNYCYRPEANAVVHHRCARIKIGLKYPESWFSWAHKIKGRNYVRFPAGMRLKREFRFRSRKG